MDHLGLDLGTTTISAAVLDADGRLLCTRTVPGGAAVAGQPWERKQDARGIEHAALSLLDGLLEFPDIGCVGLTGQMRHRLCGRGGTAALASTGRTRRAQPGPDGKSTAARLAARTGYPRLRLRPRHTRLPSGSRNHPDGAAAVARSRTISPCGCRPNGPAPHALHGRQPRSVRRNGL
ncbi:MAG: hypothetical protein ACLTG4_02680 [Oscillospiraceae bacterium]